MCLPQLWIGVGLTEYEVGMESRYLTLLLPQGHGCLTQAASP